MAISDHYETPFWNHICNLIVVIYLFKGTFLKKIISNLKKTLSFNYKISPITVHLMLTSTVKMSFVFFTLFLATSFTNNEFILSAVSLCLLGLYFKVIPRLTAKTQTIFNAIIATTSLKKHIPESGLIGYGVFLLYRRYKQNDDIKKYQTAQVKSLSRNHNKEFLYHFYSIKNDNLLKILSWFNPLICRDLKYYVTSKHFENHLMSLAKINENLSHSYSENLNSNYSILLSQFIKKSFLLTGLTVFSVHFVFKLSLYFPSLALGLVPFALGTLIAYSLYSVFVRSTLTYVFLETMNHQVQESYDSRTQKTQEIKITA